jgi:hypothetical protein
MGQATVDLPDPLQQPSNPTSSGAANGVAPLVPVDAAPVPPLNLGNTDDLLSELAADEIDRMLADSEGAANAPAAGGNAPSPFAELPRPPSLGASVHVAPPKHERRPDRATDELLSGLAAIDAGRRPAEPSPRFAAPPKAAAPSARAIPPASDAATAAPTASPSSPAPAESPVTPVAKAARSDAAAATKVSQAALQASILDEAIAVDAGEALSHLEQQPEVASAPADDELAAALSGARVDATSVGPSLSEREALESALNAVSVDAGVDEDDDVAASDVVAPTGAGLPIYLKPLAWVNAPILLLPRTLRDALGKVALLTMFNAVAVLLYVVIFRRPHH